MTRGIVALLLFATTLFGQPPATAAEKPLAVQEITRAYRGGPGVVTLYVLAHSNGQAGQMAFQQLAPRKGGGWTQKQAKVVMYNPSESRFTAYGGPTATPPLPCPAAEDICGTAGEEYDVLWIVTFRPVTGHRYFIAGPSERAMVYVGNPYWRAGRATIGARVVTAANDADAAGVVTGRGTTEAFVSASAPGGKYGSGAFAYMPCDSNDGESAGSASLKSDGSDAAVPISCEPNWYAAFSDTLDGRKWTVTGPVVGASHFPLRLFVFDFPKR